MDGWVTALDMNGEGFIESGFLLSVGNICCSSSFFFSFLFCHLKVQKNVDQSIN